MSDSAADSGSSRRIVAEKADIPPSSSNRSGSSRYDRDQHRERRSHSHREHADGERDRHRHGSSHNKGDKEHSSGSRRHKEDPDDSHRASSSSKRHRDDRDEDRHRRHRDEDRRSSSNRKRDDDRSHRHYSSSNRHRRHDRHDREAREARESSSRKDKEPSRRSRSRSPFPAASTSSRPVASRSPRPASPPAPAPHALEEGFDEDAPNFAPSGLLAAESNTVNGVALKYHEPPEARKPKTPWRLYCFKDGKEQQVLHLASQSCFLLGRDRTVVDIPLDHESCSKQHAVLQYRQTITTNEFGDRKKRIQPFLIDLESSNGSYVNDKEIPTSRYYQLRSGDTLTFGASTREYVLLDESV